MKNLTEIRLEEQGYKCVGVREVSDRWICEHRDYKTSFSDTPTSGQLIEQIVEEFGCEEIDLIPWDLKFPLDRVLVYVK